jgi:hypothetical protein
MKISCKHQQQGALPHTFQILGTGLSDINSSGLCVHVFEVSAKLRRAVEWAKLPVSVNPGSVQMLVRSQVNNSK